jgi:hypothetical protein
MQGCAGERVVASLPADGLAKVGERVEADRSERIEASRSESKQVEASRSGSSERWLQPVQSDFCQRFFQPGQSDFDRRPAEGQLPGDLAFELRSNFPYSQ